MRKIPDKNIMLFKSCLINGEYPGVESSTKYVFDKIGIEYIVDDRQSCCTGLGHYSDIYDQLSTTVIGGRNFSVAKKTDHTNIVMMCSTCYAIHKKVAKLLNNNEKVRDEVNTIYNETNLDEMKYEEGTIDSSKNIFHVVDIFFDKKEEIAKNIKIDLSEFRIATHPACHYCKVQYEDATEGFRDPKVLDEILKSCGIETIGWYDHKRSTCGAGFRQRFVNRDLSMKVTSEKLLSLKDENIDILVHMCPNCQTQFDRYQPFIGKELNIDFKIIHLNIAQLVAFVMGSDPYKVMGIQTHTVPIEPLIEKVEKSLSKEREVKKVKTANKA
ncbi:ferredoxin:CoB-CoM heterodisulfide reductase subunit HdrB [Methanobrevibacter arboriphilus]|uniref:Heterodisulfide reductase subunit B n=1 Tax=Methanobrevibacter arboriphilus TaxID=39441 RepID=A0ACA8R4T6_METAZ|nr:ferredoxin:CoB-CoM heterodisulfide reductase subunit HdrB [Methanobrevibacter arboriphilus]MCC7561708.1 CoB--CoM heterodisulfide reductase iron-sulfur subunit B family protein [Methanobrevibacter arboriphilus]BBL62518.1 heterodisulfide reductase subunit B [Methanobrevibacter arboriphilus]